MGFSDKTTTVAFCHQLDFCGDVAGLLLMIGVIPVAFKKLVYRLLGPLSRSLEQEWLCLLSI